MLNPNSPLPLYHQLADIVTEQIRSGEYRPGESIPSEISIAKEYSIGRPTVRQAMDLLVRKGLVERKRGSGTFVKFPSRQVDLFSLAGTSQAFLTEGIVTSSRIIHPISLVHIEDSKIQDNRIKDNKIADNMSEEERIADNRRNPFCGSSAFLLSRLTLVKKEDLPSDTPEDGEKRGAGRGERAVLLEDIYLHPILFQGIERMDLENRSLSQIISEQYYLKPETGRQSFTISNLPGEKAHLLELTPSDPLLEVERILNFPGADGAIFSRLYCRTDRFAFSQVIKL